MGMTFFVVALLGLLWVLNAYWPQRAALLLAPSFMGAWLTIELAPFLLVGQAIGVGAFLAGGALDDPIGYVGLALAIAGAAGLGAIIAVNRRTTVYLGETFGELDLAGSAPRFPRSHVVFPFLLAHRQGVTRIKGITFSKVATAKGGEKRLRLDVTKPVDAKPGDLRPGILQIHGGGWVIGDKREQGLPLLGHLAANGWVGINANYRLSPKATFPDHLVDLKQAIAWYRAHATEHGADPDFLCVTGGSAGGHLTALVALTANDPEYQTGIESVDTSVRAAVPFYGVYDFTNRLGTQAPTFLGRFIEPIVMKRKLADDPEAFAAASPLDLVRPDAPPFLVVHGDRDTLAPVVDAREFVRLLQDVSEAPVLYAEMHGAQHAFDVFPSFRTARVIEAVERFLAGVHDNYLRGHAASSLDEAELVDDLVDDTEVDAEQSPVTR